MNYRNIPNSEEKLSILGFGLMRLPVREDGSIDEKKVEEMVQYALDKGVNYFDTAWPYHDGESEPVFGKIVEKLGIRDRIKIATKLPSWLIKAPEDMEEYLNKQLERLRTDHIDYYLLHALNRDTWKKLKDMGVLEFLERMKSEGKIRNIGFSFHDGLPIFKDIVDSYNWDFCMIQYNFLDLDYQAGQEGMDYAAAKGIGVFVMEPLRGGSLVNNIPEDVQKEWDSGTKNYKPVEWALRWVWNNKPVVLLLSGMGSMEQMSENVEIASEIGEPVLDKNDMEKIMRVRKIYTDRLQVNCTACKYCLPCPAGVSIPDVFKIYNNAFMFKDLEKYKDSYLKNLNPKNRAGACIMCGKCEKLCPQNIEIRKHMEKIVELFER